MIDRARGIALAAIGLGLLVLLMVGGDPATREASPTTIADLEVPSPSVPPPPPPPPPVTTRPRPAPPAVVGAQPVAGIAELGIERVVVVVGSDDAGHEVRVIESDGLRFIPLPSESRQITISPGLDRVAFVRDGSLGIVDLAAGTIDHDLAAATSVAWAGPASVVWSTDSEVVRASVSAGNVVSIDDRSPVDDATIVGGTEAGAWITTPSEFGRSTIEVRFLPADGSEPEPTFGDLTYVPPNGRGALIANLEFDGWDWLFAWFDGDLTPLPWAPWDAGVASVLAAVTQDRYAFVGTTDGVDWLEVWSADGVGGDRWGLPKRVAGVRWSQQGDRLVVAATDAVLIVDPSGPSIDLIEVGDPVSDAAIAP